MLRLAPASAAHAPLRSEEDKELSNLGKRVEYIRYNAHIPDATTIDIFFPQERSGITPPQGPPPQDQRLDQREPSEAMRASSRPLVAGGAPRHPSRSPRARARPLIPERHPP